MAKALTCRVPLGLNPMIIGIQRRLTETSRRQGIARVYSSRFFENVLIFAVHPSGVSEVWRVSSGWSVSGSRVPQMGGRSTTRGLTWSNRVDLGWSDRIPRVATRRLISPSSRSDRVSWARNASQLQSISAKAPSPLALIAIDHVV